MVRNLIAVVAAMAAVGATAQVDPMPYVSIQAANIQYGMLLKSNLRSSNRRAVRRPAGTTTASAPGAALGGANYFAEPARPGAPAASFAYQPSASLKRAALDGYVQRIARTDSAAAKATGAELAKYDIGKIYSGIVAPFGYSANDSADALAAYTLLGYLIANGAPDPSRGEAAGVRAQIAQKMAQNAQLSAPGTRAELGEELKLLFVTLHAGWLAARREGNLQQYSDGVANLFMQNGTDLRRLRLTNAGFAGRG